MYQMPRTLFDKLPASGAERGIGISRFKDNITITNDAAQQQLTGQTAEQTLASINHDTANNATLTNLYEQDKESIETGFAIGRGLTQNFASFMNYMAKDMDSVAKSPAVDKNGNPIEKDGKRLTNQEAYQAGLELGDTVNAAGESINYATRQDLWGSGGTGNRIATALIGAYSGNVSNGASTLLQNTALNVVRTYGATEIKRLADGFSTETDDKGNPIPNATSETVRGLLHAIAGCAGASAAGGDCTSAGLASAGTVAMNNAMTALLNLNPNEMTDTQKQAYSNLMGTLVAGVSTAVGGDAAAASLASKVEVDNNEMGIDRSAYYTPNFNLKDKTEIEIQIAKNRAKRKAHDIANTKVQVEGSGNIGMGAHAHGTVKATIGMNHGITVDEVEVGVGVGAALRVKLGGTVVEGTPKNPSAESGAKPYSDLWDKSSGSESRSNTIGVGTKAALEGDLIILHGEASTYAGVDSKVGGRGDTSTYAGGGAEVKVQPQIGAGAAAYWDIFNWQYKNDKKEGN